MTNSNLELTFWRNITSHVDAGCHNSFGANNNFLTWLPVLSSSLGVWEQGRSRLSLLTNPMNRFACATRFCNIRCWQVELLINKFPITKHEQRKFFWIFFQRRRRQLMFIVCFYFSTTKESRANIFKESRRNIEVWIWKQRGLGK